MIISRFSQEYNCGCGRGIIDYEKPNILTFLNSVIEWDWSVNANKKSPKNELVPGDTLEIQSTSGTKNILAVDSENKLVLIVSETGPFALERICKEVVIPEYEMFIQELDCFSSFEWSLKTGDEVDLTDSSFQRIPIPDYNKFKIILDRLVKKELRSSGFIMELKFAHDLMFGLESTIYVTQKEVLFRESQVTDPEAIPVIWDDLLGYLYQNYDRIPRPSIDWENSESVERFFEAYSHALGSMSKEEREKFIKHEGIEDTSLIDRIINFELKEEEKNEETA